MLSIDTILHPTDFSEPAQRAFELACSLASQHQAKLLLVHVIAPPAPPPLPYNEAGLGTGEEDAALAIHRLEKMRASHSLVTMEYVLAEGDPAEQIIRVAREVDADLIVIGTHGRTGLNRAVLGSVAERVVRDAPCQVTTVRDRSEVTGAATEHTAASRG